MATTVTYKGQTLTTVDNETKVLETAGTWVEDDFTLTDVTEGGGGDADHWVRPSEFPNLSLLDRSDEVVYISCMANEGHGYITINCRSTKSNKFNVAMGEIVNGEFVTEDEWHDAQGYVGTFKLYFGKPGGTYKVFKVTADEGYHLTGFNVGETYKYGEYTQAKDGYPSVAVLGRLSGVVEVYGNLPYATYAVQARTCYYLQSFDVMNIKPNDMNYAFAYDWRLENVDVSTWDLSNCTSLSSTFRETKLKWFNGYKSLNLSNVTNMSDAFTKIEMEEFDMTSWELPKVTTMNNMFSSSKLKTVKLKGSQVSCTYSAIFQNCNVLQSVDMSGFDASLATNITRFINGCELLGSISFEDLNLASVSTAGNAQYIFDGATSIRTLTIPASLSIIGNNTFNNMELCSEFHFLATTPPTLNNTNAFNIMNQRVTKKIYVPYSADHSILEAYKTATNWSTYASYMEEEPE